MNEQPLQIPATLRARHEDWTPALAWENVPYTTTWRLTRDGATRFLKLAVTGWDVDLAAERARLDWAAGRIPTPRALDGGVEGDVQWLLTEALSGTNAAAHTLRAQPEVLVPILARALRALHETPIDGCPFDARTDALLERARARVAAGRIDPAYHFHPEHTHLTPETALAQVEAERPADDDIVLTHGDYCLPNVLLDEHGALTGYVDLGDLGVADRWWDLAVATWSVTWNLGPGWEEVFLRAYGVDPDPARTAFYRLLYDLVA